MSKIAGKNKPKKQKKIVNGGHVKNIPLYIENVLMLKKYIFEAEVALNEKTYKIKTPFSVENFELPETENLSERKVLDWIYKVGNFKKMDLSKNPRVLFSTFECQMIAIKPSSAEKFNDAYIDYLKSKNVEPRTAKGGLKSNVRGCLSMAEFHNLFLYEFLREKLGLI